MTIRNWERFLTNSVVRARAWINEAFGAKFRLTREVFG